MCTSIIVDKENYKSYREVKRKYGSFSIVEFSPDKKQAFVYLGYYQAPMVSGGFYIIYKRRGYQWKKGKVIGAWAA